MPSEFCAAAWLFFRDKVSPHLTQEKRDAIEKQALAWKPGITPR